MYVHESIIECELELSAIEVRHLTTITEAELRSSHRALSDATHILSQL